MSKFYLVDLENVGWCFIDFIQDTDLSPRDKIFVFYGESSPICSNYHLNKISKIKAKLEMIEIQIGVKNALDFQLACFLGRIAKKGHEYYIVSNDKSFAVLKSFIYPIAVEIIKTKPVDTVDSTLKSNVININKNIKEQKTSILDNFSEDEISKIRTKISKEIKSNNIINYSNYSSIVGMIMSEISKCSDFDEFSEKVSEITKEKSYKNEILKICKKYIS